MTNKSRSAIVQELETGHIFLLLPLLVSWGIARKICPFLENKYKAN